MPTTWRRPASLVRAPSSRRLPVTTIWSGLALGAIYALVALGYNVVFVSSNVFNFAHAQLVMLGTFLAFWGTVTLKLPIGVVFVLSAVIVAAVAVVEERTAIRTV